MNNDFANALQTRYKGKAGRLTESGNNQKLAMIQFFKTDFLCK